MTCFWDGIMQCLTTTEMKNIFNANRRPNRQEFVCFLKRENIIASEVCWNGKTLSNKFLSESYEHVKIFHVCSIRKGYDCSSCDPFLVLICKLFYVNIDHMYNGAPVKYTSPTSKRTIRVASNKSHFWKI
jgi:hypothetical protein